MVYHGTLVTKYLNIDPVKGVYIFYTQGRIYVMKSLKIVLLIGAGITTLNSATEIKHTDKMFVDKSDLELKRMAAAVMNENAMLKAGGGGAGGAAAAESAALALCITSGDNTPYINLAKETVKAKLAAILGADKDVLKNALDAFIGRLDNTAVVLSPPSRAGGNPAHATDAHLQSARKAAIEMAMVKMVNDEMDRLAAAGAAGGVDVGAIQTQLMAVFAGR